MRIISLKLLLLVCVTSMAQNKNGNLLFLQVDINQDLKIDKHKTFYLAVELNANLKPVAGQKAKMVFFDGFTDGHLSSCTSGDSIRIKTFFKNETFTYQEKYSSPNLKIIESNFSKMRKLIDLKVLANGLHNQNIAISYIMLTSNYCTGPIAKYDGGLIGYEDRIILIIDDIKINNQYIIDKSDLQNVIKSIDYSTFIY